MDRVRERGHDAGKARAPQSSLLPRGMAGKRLDPQTGAGGRGGGIGAPNSRILPPCGPRRSGGGGPGWGGKYQVGGKVSQPRAPKEAWVAVPRPARPDLAGRRPPPHRLEKLGTGVAQLCRARRRPRAFPEGDLASSKRLALPPWEGSLLGGHTHIFLRPLWPPGHGPQQAPGRLPLTLPQQGHS